MKVGDKIPVTIAGQPVAQATVKELGDGTVTLEFPATRAVMAVRTEIDTTPVASGGAEHAILGVENPITNTPELVETPTVPADAATPAEASQGDSVDAATAATPAVTTPVEAPVEQTAPAAPVATDES